MNPKEATGRAPATALPLHGKTILITRPKDQAEEFARLLIERGASVLFIPTIQITEPRSWQNCDRAIENIQEYDGFIFTSANGVQGFFRRLSLRTVDSARKELGKKHFYVVGEKTGDALVAEGMKPIFLAGVASGNEMAEALLRLPLPGKTYLFPQGNLAGEELGEMLRSNGVRVDEITVYETVAPQGADAQSIHGKLENESINILTFFSPSSVKNLLTLVPPALVTSKTIAVIGTSTEAAARDAGLSVHIVPARPTSRDMVDAIVQYYKEQEPADYE
jgi:uroporphyrinogen-III synthase